MTTLAIGSAVPLILEDGGKVVIATSGGFATVLESPAGGIPVTTTIGPEALRRSFGPYGEGATVTLTNVSCSALDYEASTKFDPGATLTLTLGGVPAVLTNPMLQATNSVNDYTQLAAQNKSATANASADIIAYPNNVTSSDLTGFVNIGITSSAYAQAAYAITGQNEAYLFASAPSGAGKTGDMIIATDSTGSANSIWFGTGGFAALANRRAGFVGANFRPYANASCGLGVANVGFTKLYMDYTNTGTIGAVTISKAAGRVNVAAAASSVVVTNTLCTAASKVFATIAQNDTTAVLKNVVPAAGSFTINLNAAATANTAVDFFIVNAD